MSDGKCLVGEARQQHNFSPKQAWTHVTQFPYHEQNQPPVIPPTQFDGTCRSCLHKTSIGILLRATTAVKARSEVASRFPQGANLNGYDETDDCVYISLVRARGDNHPVATASKGKRAVKFYARPL